MGIRHAMGAVRQFIGFNTALSTPTNIANSITSAMHRFYTTKWAPAVEESRPPSWGKLYPQAEGSRQSPIDIVTADVQPDPTLVEKPLQLKYDAVDTICINNSGSGWRVDVKSSTPNIWDGPLSDRYQMVQFHTHWSECCSEGSEHRVDGIPFAGELHLVHYNMDRYENPRDAACSEDGLAVLGVFLQVGGANSEFEKICETIDRIRYKEKKCNDLQPVDVNVLLPTNTADYWTYEGSLTTPPCFESVTWIVFKEPITISEEQLATFRTLLTLPEERADNPTELDGPVLRNFRPPQPIEGRVIREPPSQ